MSPTLLEESGFASSRESVQLKGIAEPTDVVRLAAD